MERRKWMGHGLVALQHRVPAPPGQSGVPRPRHLEWNLRGPEEPQEDELSKRFMPSGRGTDSASLPDPGVLELPLSGCYM